MIYCTCLYSEIVEEFYYKTKFKSLRVGETKISIISNHQDNKMNKILTIESSSNKFIDLIYKLRHFSTIIMDQTDFSLLAITQKLQQGHYIDSYNATIDYKHSSIYYQNMQDIKSNKNKENIIIPFEGKIYDPFSIIYYLRNLNLHVGEQFNFQSYSKKKLRDITLSIIKKEEIETPFITSECLVVVPQSLDKTYLLKHQGEMKIWFTSDSLLIPIKIQQKMKHGTMELILRDYVIKK